MAFRTKADGVERPKAEPEHTVGERRSRHGGVRDGPALGASSLSRGHPKPLRDGGVVLGAVFFPALLITVPGYALIDLGDPLPAMIGYRGALLAWALMAILGDGLNGTVRFW